MPDRLDPTLDELSQQNGASQGLPPPSPTPDWYARMAEQQRRWGMPPASQQIPDIIDQTLGGLPRAAKRATEYSLNPPADYNLEEAIRRNTDVAMRLPPASIAFGAGEMAMINSAMRNPERFAGTDIGMFKLVPRRGKYYSYDLLDHNDMKLAELDNVTTHKGYVDVGYLRGPVPLGIRQQKLDPLNPALRLNRGAHGLTTKEVLGMGAALAREFPQHSKGGGFRISGAHSIGNPTSSTPDQRIGLSEARRTRALQETEDLPRFPEMEQGLTELARSAAQKAARPTEHTAASQRAFADRLAAQTPRMPSEQWMNEWMNEFRERERSRAQVARPPPVPQQSALQGEDANQLLSRMSRELGLEE